jgi:hypothetical protein
VELRALDASGCSELTGKCFQQQTFPNIERICLSDCDGFVEFSLLASLTTLRAADLSFCDFTTKAALSELSFISDIDDHGCYGATQDKAASGKVEPQRAEIPNNPTSVLIEAMRKFVMPPYTSQSFSIWKRDAFALSLLTTVRKCTLDISWADIDWKHISWHFGCLRPRWSIFLMDDASIQVHARPVWP